MITIDNKYEFLEEIYVVQFINGNCKIVKGKILETFCNFSEKGQVRDLKIFYDIKLYCAAGIPGDKLFLSKIPEEQIFSDLKLLTNSLFLAIENNPELGILKSDIATGDKLSPTTFTIGGVKEHEAAMEKLKVKGCEPKASGETFEAFCDVTVSAIKKTSYWDTFCPDKIKND